MSFRKISWMAKTGRLTLSGVPVFVKKSFESLAASLSKRCLQVTCVICRNVLWNLDRWLLVKQKEPYRQAVNKPVVFTSSHTFQTPMGGARGQDIRFIFFNVHFYPVIDEVSPPPCPTTSCCLQLDSSNIVQSTCVPAPYSEALSTSQNYINLSVIYRFFFSIADKGQKFHLV